MFAVVRIRLGAWLPAASRMPLPAQSPAGGLVGIIRDASGAGAPAAAA